MTATMFGKPEIRAKSLRWMQPYDEFSDTGIDDPDLLCEIASYLAGIAFGGWVHIHGGDRSAALDALRREIAAADQLAERADDQRSSEAPRLQASLTERCAGSAQVTCNSGQVTLNVFGADWIAGPPDDDDPRPNSGTVVGLTPSEARALASALVEAAKQLES